MMEISPIGETNTDKVIHKAKVKVDKSIRMLDSIALGLFVRRKDLVGNILSLGI